VLISLLSLLTISAGVFLGAPMPKNALCSKPGRKSPTVGRSGSIGERAAEVTASAVSLPGAASTASRRDRRVLCPSLALRPHVCAALHEPSRDWPPAKHGSSPGPGRDLRRSRPCGKHPAPRRVQEFSLRSDLASPTLLAFGALGPCAPYRDIPTTIQASVATSTLPREDNRQNKSPARAHVCAKICGCVSAASVKNALHQEPFVAVRHTSGGKAILFKIYYPW
jgi:hypothetical protein